MPVSTRRLRPRSARRRARPVRLHLEPLETRTLLSVAAGPEPFLFLRDQEANDTMDRAQDLGALGFAGPMNVIGDIADGVRADVDWYALTLDQPARVTLSLSGLQGQPQPGVLSLYNTALDDFSDPFNLLGHRLLAQVEGSSPTGDASVERVLGAGTYFVAVSGAGNRFFHPFLADSGYAGGTGPYRLQAAAAALPFTPQDGPQVLTTEPAPDAALDRSPLMLRVALSSELDPGTIIPDLNVQLTDGSGQTVPLAGATFSTAARELQLIPAAPLGPGRYLLFLAGDSDQGWPVLTGLDGTPLGRDSLHLTGQDYTFSFEVTGAEGRSGTDPVADDTPATASALGSLTAGAFIQVSGVIGDDPTDPRPFNPADVDLYHFQIQGPGRFAFAAEVFARRIGSSLDPGASLFQLDPADGTLHLLVGNDNTLNGTAASDNSSFPLLSDSALYAGLTEGDYYLAVTNGPNTPDPLRRRFPGRRGVFDPEVTHSGVGRGPIGPYVLNVQVTQDPTPPRILAVTFADSNSPPAPPTQFLVQFSKTVNLQELAYRAFLQALPEDELPVYIHGADGNDYFPRLVSFDGVSNQATFLMLDALPNGVNLLHFAGDRGLTDLAGNLLVGNDPSGDYVVPLAVDGPIRGDDGNPLQRSSREPNDDLATAQDLGVLFPHELQANVTVVRSPATGSGPSPADGDDYFRFQVLQGRQYFFLVGDTSLPGRLQLSLLEATGEPVLSLEQADDTSLLATLEPGTYVLHVTGWDPAEAADLRYQILINLSGSFDNPPPLTVGPAPVLRLRLVSDSGPSVLPPDDPAPLPIVSLPGGGPTPAPPAVTPPVVLVNLPGLGAAAAGISVTGPDTGPRSPAFTNLFSSLLADLRAGPVGGVTDFASGAELRPVDRVQVSAANSLLVAGLVRLTVLTEGPLSSGTALPPKASPAAAGGQPESGFAILVSKTVQGLVESWRELMNGLLSVARWLRSAPAPVHVAAVVEDALDEEDAEEASIPEQAAPVASSLQAEPAPLADWLLAAGAALVGAAVIPARSTRRRQPGLLGPQKQMGQHESA